METDERAAISRALGRPVTDDEFIQIRDRIAHHVTLLAQERPSLSGNARMAEAGRRTARELVARMKTQKFELERQIFDLQHSPNPMKWALRDRSALVATTILCGFLAVIVGYIVEQAGFGSLSDWITDGSSALAWSIAGSVIGATGYYALKFGARR